MKIDLKDKIIVITGASRGIGKEIAIQLAIENASVIMTYNCNEKEAKKIFHKISQYNKKCMLMKCDVTNMDEVNLLKRTVIRKYGRVDVVINNAGSCSDNPCAIMPYEQWSKIIAVNLNGVFIVTRAFLREMIKQRKGKIINIASLKGITGSRGQVNYSASKAGVIGFTKALAKEVGDFNISANAICPGFIQTDMNKNNQLKKVNATRQSVMGIEANMSDLVDFVIYMCSEHFRGVSGQTFHIDSRM